MYLLAPLLITGMPFLILLFYTKPKMFLHYCFVFADLGPENWWGHKTTEQTNMFDRQIEKIAVADTGFFTTFIAYLWQFQWVLFGYYDLFLSTPYLKFGIDYVNDLALVMIAMIPVYSNVFLPLIVTWWIISYNSTLFTSLLETFGSIAPVDGLSFEEYKGKFKADYKCI